MISVMLVGRRNSSADAGTSDAIGAGSANAALVRELGRDELEIVFLGTGAAIPAKYRNVSGIYINLFARGGIMLDCGAPLPHMLCFGRSMVAWQQDPITGVLVSRVR